MLHRYNPALLGKAVLRAGCLHGQHCKIYSRKSAAANNGCVRTIFYKGLSCLGTLWEVGCLKISADLPADCQAERSISRLEVLMK